MNKQKYPITIADLFDLRVRYNLDNEELLSIHQSYLEQLEPLEALDYYNRNMTIVMYILKIINKKELKRILYSR